MPHEIVQAGNSSLAETMGGLAEELKKHAADESAAAPETFVLIHGLQNFKKLRQEDEFSFSSGESAAISPAAVLQNLISDGPALGIHLIATCATSNNVVRFLGRKTLTEFEMRVLFQMSASDSASLVESPDAGTLGLHRALYYNDREGYTEIFRPYARPGNEWIEEMAGALAARAGRPRATRLLRLPPARRLLSRSRFGRARGSGRFFGALAKFTPKMTAETRIALSR